MSDLSNQNAPLGYAPRAGAGLDYDGVVPGDAGAAADVLLSEGQQAVQAGQWSTAKDAFEAVLEREESGDALFGLGVALWWLGETEAALRQWRRAYAAFRRGSDPAPAVLTAVYLCLAYRMSLGNLSASRGWLGRAASLVDDRSPAASTGWVSLCRAFVANDSGHPREGERWAIEARRIARTTADADLELCAVSELGTALVDLGRVEEGAALLDEAMAGALAGEGNDLDTVVLVSCRTITSCSRGGEVSRATQWIRAADDFNRRYGSAHLYTTCRTHYGSILFAAGDWEQAEKELTVALRIGRAAEPALHAEALAKLAELRLVQGRVDEAARLLTGYEDHPATAYPVGVLHLARAAPAVASSVVRRRLDDLDECCLEGTALLELLTEAEIARGAVPEAVIDAGRLVTLGAGDLAVARGERALGRALIAAEAPASAVPHLHRARAAFGRTEMPLEISRTRLLLARALADDDRETAIAEARAALAGLELLGAAPDADAAAAFLRSLGVKAARSGPKGVGLLTKREREVLALLGEGLSNRAIAERLFITRKTVEHHVAQVLRKLELSGRGEATAYALRGLAAKENSASR